MNKWLTNEILEDGFGKPGRNFQVNLRPHKAQNQILLAAMSVEFDVLLFVLNVS